MAVVNHAARPGHALDAHPVILREKRVALAVRALAETPGGVTSPRNATARITYSQRARRRSSGAPSCLLISASAAIVFRSRRRISSRIAFAAPQQGKNQRAPAPPPVNASKIIVRAAPDQKPSDVEKHRPEQHQGGAFDQRGEQHDQRAHHRMVQPDRARAEIDCQKDQGHGKGVEAQQSDLRPRRSNSRARRNRARRPPSDGVGRDRRRARKRDPAQPG